MVRQYLLKNIFVVFFFVLCASLAQDAPKFPFSSADPKLNVEKRQEALVEAQENDVDVTLPRALLYKGLGLFQEEEYDEAILFLEEALQIDPSMTAGWEALGWAYVRTDRPEKAYNLWKYVQTLMPNDWMPYNLLAQAAMLQADWVKADEMFRKMFAIKPELFEQRYWYGQNLLRLGKMEEAESVFRQLIKEEPERLDVQIDLANLITYTHEYDEAVKIWRYVNAELPGNPKFMMTQANLEVRVGELNTANQLCEDVLAIENIDELMPEAGRRARALRVDIADFGDATKQSVKRLQDLIDQTENPVERSMQRLRLANRTRLLRRDSPDLYTEEQILSIIREAVKDDPYNMEAMIFYAEQCVMAKQYIRARSAAKYVLEKFNPNNIRAMDVLFECELNDKDYQAAEQIVHDRFATSDPTDPMRYRLLARIFMAKGEFQEALREIDLMETTAQRGTVLTLVYNGLTESDWVATTSARRLRDHVNSLLDAGFEFIAPSDIPKYAGLRDGESSIASVEEKPWLARTIDYVWYQITGTRRFKPSDKGYLKDQKPMKYVAITFDDGRRSSFMLGTDVAEYLGVPFGMFVATKPHEDYQFALSGWEEIRKYAETGAWEIGSHLYAASEVAPADSTGLDLRHPLPNRLWIPAKNRMESMNEWDDRMRNEFYQSSQIVEDEMGDLSAPLSMLSYPFDDLGQTSACNLYDLRNPMKSIISEASRRYQLGFIRGTTGYTTVGDNLLMIRRYKPNWNDEGSDLVRTVYETHPVFVARRMRIELALYMNRPHMAEDMIALMRRDGYPEDLCRDLNRMVLAHFRNIPPREEGRVIQRNDVGDPESDDAKDSPSQDRETQDAGDVTHHVFNPFAEDLDLDLAVSNETDAKLGKRDVSVTNAESNEPKNKIAEIDVDNDEPWFKPSNLSVGVEGRNSKANDQFEVSGYGARAAMNINPRTTVGAEFFITKIDQTFQPRWNSVTNDPSVVEKREFEAERVEYRARMSHRFDSGATLSGSIGSVNLDLNYTDENTDGLEDDPGSKEFWRDVKDGTIVFDLGMLWYPRNDMRVHLFYAKDVVQSAVKFIESDSLGGEMQWRPWDSLLVSTKGQYWSYSDDNALFSMKASAIADVMPDVGVKAGLEAYTISSTEACDYYWTPYWDQRLTGILRYYRMHKGYNFTLNFQVGLQREDGRPLRRKQDNGLSSASDWGYIWGFGARYYHELDDHWALSMEGDVTALRDYVDHTLIIGLTYMF